jgi:hypothetical protein
MSDELTAFRQEAREWIAGNFPGSLKGGGGGGLSQAHARIINEEPPEARRSESKAVVIFAWGGLRGLSVRRS